VVKTICAKYEWCEKVLGYVILLQGVDESHGLPHTIRVLCNAIELEKKLGKSVDEEALVLATLLHDIGRGFEEYVGLHHAIISAELATGILAEIGIGDEEVDKIKRMILEHSFSLGGRPSSIESCILSDADKLDALGAIGVYRLIETSAMRGRVIVDTVAHVWDKLVKLPEMMCLEESRKIARKRLETLLTYINELVKEIDLYESAVAESFDKALSFLEKQGNRSIDWLEKRELA